MGREPIPTWYFALVIARRNDEFLLVHERKHGQRWYLPAGRVEPGETLTDGAVRETREEAGIIVRTTGIYRIEHTPSHRGTRVRVIFGAEPIDDTPPKSEPDDESLEAGWFDLDRVRELPLRGPEVLRMFEEVVAGAPLHPISLLAPEGTPLLG